MKKYIFVLILLSGKASALFAQVIDNRRVLVLSGGGSRGAWGGGFLRAMDSVEHPMFIAAVGTSTGSLLAPLILSDDDNRFNVLYIGYTQVDQKTIFNVNPFNKEGKVKGFNAFVRFLLGKKNIGESHPLKTRLQKFYSEDDYENLKKYGKEFVACVTNLTSGAIEYKSSLQNNYTDMIDWVWASSNQPVFMSTLHKEGSQYVDGGIRDNIPIVHGIEMALKNNIERVDVIIHNSTQQSSLKTWPENKNKDGILTKVFRIIDVFSDETRVADIIAGAAKAQEIVARSGKNIELHFHSMPYQTIVDLNCHNSLIFLRERQEKLWAAGYDYYVNKYGRKPKGPPDILLEGIKIYMY